MYICVLCLKLDVNATKAPHSTARHQLHSALNKQTDLNYYTTTISHAFHIMILPLLSVYHFCCCRLNTYHQDPLLAPPTLCPSVPFNDQRHQTQTILSSLTITRDNNNSVKTYYAIFKFTAESLFLFLSHCHCHLFCSLSQLLPFQRTHSISPP